MLIKLPGLAKVASQTLQLAVIKFVRRIPWVLVWLA